MMAEKPLPIITEGTIDHGSMDGDTPTKIASGLIERFTSALKASDVTALEDCFFAEQAYWKDQLALTYHLRTIQQAGIIASSLIETNNLRGSEEIRLDGDASFSPITPTLQFIDCNFTFKTMNPAARCHGKIILLPQKPRGEYGGSATWKIWVLSTRLEDFVFHPEDLSLLRGPAKQLGILEQFETEVIIIGGGNSAVTVAARLKALGVESVMLDRNPSPGDNWALRYSAMKFHIPTAICTMAYLEYPKEQHFPHFLTRDELANQVKRYVETFNLNVVNSAKVMSTTFNQASKLYTVTFWSPTGRRVAVARHLVQATGLGSQKPHMPPMADANLYKGVSVHSTAYRNAKDLKMLGVKSALVIGSANTAFDILEDCYAAGMKTTMVVRSPTYIFPVAYVCDPAAHGNYEELGVEADKDSMAIPTNIEAQMVRGHFSHLAFQEPDRYAALSKAGFPVLDSRSPECCLMVNLFEKGGGHYLDVGGTALISEGKAGVKANVEPVAFTATGLKFCDGSTLDADAVVWCTGFADRDARKTAAEMLGASTTNEINKMSGEDQHGNNGILGPRDIAARLDATWGVDAEGEVRGVWKRQSRLDNYWVMGGDTRLQRWHSRTLALQIKADLAGILPPAYLDTPTPKHRSNTSSRL
ncbi:hypothetical protein BDP81DRAFT_308322 [Colletotrichum phormii]|uniref:FAD/NAD(P)-binding domain-containing protein n=1 Tax=Colletotrichum phormii TaxID=359342 RepID=A0AAJ0A247_9PEZI|nr:uncharacterized protein BDP81DRAFT_308322 [Colletotrichum phormii]KAK1655074.1 hypothetical protein BDP81DRAFT_308322 [Colletotrichum phormii]